MAHTNGKESALLAADAGVNSLEHGNYQDAESLQALLENGTVWVPTVVTVRNLLGDGRYPEEMLRPIWESAKEAIRVAFAMGVTVALGSDGGAYRVLHGQGLVDEYQAFCDILGAGEALDAWLQAGEKKLQEAFVSGR